MENGLKAPSIVVEKHMSSEAQSDWPHCSCSREAERCTLVLSLHSSPSLLNVASKPHSVDGSPNIPGWTSFSHQGSDINGKREGSLGSWNEVNPEEGGRWIK